jgi:hypothetical protein
MTAQLLDWLVSLLASRPTAGQGVNLWLYRAARHLHAHITAPEIVAVLLKCVANCGRIVTRAEVERAVANSLAHATEPGVICWREVDPADVVPEGRPKSINSDELLALPPPEGLKPIRWQKLAKAECGISEATFHRERRALVKAKRILKSKVTGKWQPIQKA